VQEQSTSDPFHLELTTMLLQPPPLVRVFFWDWLLLLLTGRDFVIVKAMDESEGVSDDQQTDLVAKVIPEPLFKRGLQRMKLRTGYFGILELV